MNNFCSKSKDLTTTDLPPRNRPDPDKREVEYNYNYAHDPERARIVRAIVAEDDGKDDTAEITRGTYEAGKDTCS
jgi:hypothetical protein